MNDDITVHVASWNTASATELCLRTMRRHAGHPFALVVGDGGSTDGSLAMLRDFAQRGWLELEVRAGAHTRTGSTPGDAPRTPVTWCSPIPAWTSGAPAA
jgi:GT2 family glycosyltransferase